MWLKKRFFDFICWPLERSSIILFPTDLLSGETKHLRNYGKEAFLCVCVHYFCSEVTTKEDKEDWSSSSLWERDKMSKYFICVCVYVSCFFFSFLKTLLLYVLTGKCEFGLWGRWHTRGRLHCTDLSKSALCICVICLCISVICLCICVTLLCICVTFLSIGVHWFCF